MTDKEGRKVAEHHEDPGSYFAGSARNLDYLDQGADGKAAASFANLLKLHGPLVIMDEAHNATTPLSYAVYERPGPRAVVELTATPDASNQRAGQRLGWRPEGREHDQVPGGAEGNTNDWHSP